MVDNTQKSFTKAEITDALKNLPVTGLAGGDGGGGIKNGTIFPSPMNPKQLLSYSGGFAAVYPIRLSDGRKVALRSPFAISSLNDYEYRYKILSNYIKKKIIPPVLSTLNI